MENTAKDQNKKKRETHKGFTVLKTHTHKHIETRKNERNTGHSQNIEILFANRAFYNEL